MTASYVVLLIVICGALGISALFFYGVYQLLLSHHLAAKVRRTVSQIAPRLRMLMFGWEFPPYNSGGLGVASLGLAKGIAKTNTDLTIVLPKKLEVESDYASIRYAEIPESKAIAVNSPLSPYLGTASYALAADGSPLYGNNLVDEVMRYGKYGGEIAQEEEHDVIYAHDWLSFPAGMAAKRTSGRPLVAHVHATEFDRTSDGGVNQSIYNIEREGFHFADKIIAVSERTKRMIVERYGIAAAKVRVVHNGIDESTAPTPASSDRLKALKSAGYEIVLFMGRLTVQKGPDYFLQAAKEVLRTRPQTLFVVAGSGDMERQLIEQAAALGISDNVLFSGFLRGSEQYEAYKAADLFVMPSVSEPFGITALEAMHIGTPVIISKQSGVAEAAPNAVQVDFWDTQKMAASIIEVLSQPALRDRLINQGHEVAARMTWDRAAGSVRAVMDELVPAPAYAPAYL